MADLQSTIRAFLMGMAARGRVDQETAFAIYKDALGSLKLLANQGFAAAVHNLRERGLIECSWKNDPTPSPPGKAQVGVIDKLWVTQSGRRAIASENALE